MDADRFDGLAKAFSSSGTRRGILWLIAAIPLTGGLQAVLTPQSTLGQGNGAVIGGGGRRRHKARRDRDKDRRENKPKQRHKHKHKHKKKPEDPCVPDCTGKVCGSDGCKGSCGACECGRSCCAGVCCEEQGTVCLDGACCVPECDLDACGVNAPRKCGVASCGTCADGQFCVNGACNDICATSPCTVVGGVVCANCFVTPQGARTCSNFAGGTGTGRCFSDADCCPGTRCGAVPNTFDEEFVCYELGSCAGACNRNEVCGHPITCPDCADCRCAGGVRVCSVGPVGPGQYCTNGMGIDRQGCGSCQTDELCCDNDNLCYEQCPPPPPP